MARIAASPSLARLAAIAVAAVVAGCQHTTETSTPKTASIDSGITPEYVASLPPEQSRPVVTQLANDVVAAENAACKTRADLDWKACMSSRMVIDFDRYGFLANHCRDKPDYKSLRDCALFGRSGVDWILAAGSNPDTDFDWSKPQQSHDAALKRLNDVLTKSCEDKPEEPGNSCFTSESAKRLGLSGAVAAHCAGRRTLEQRGACIIDTHDAAMYRAALARVAG